MLHEELYTLRMLVNFSAFITEPFYVKMSRHSSEQIQLDYSMCVLGEEGGSCERRLGGGQIALNQSVPNIILFLTAIQWLYPRSHLL